MPRSGEAGGNTHTLLAEGEVRYQLHRPGVDALAVATIEVGDGAEAYLAHPEHAYLGIGPGRYEIRRQREAGERDWLVAD